MVDITWLILYKSELLIDLPNKNDVWEGGGKRGGARIFFSDLGICMSLRDMRALLGGFGGMLPRENFLKRCNLVRFRVYFDQILSLFFSRNAIFYIKNKYFRYTFVRLTCAWQYFGTLIFELFF